MTWHAASKSTGTTVLRGATQRLRDIVAAIDAIHTGERRLGTVGIRIILDHRYHAVDADVVWNTVDQDLQPLRDAAERLLDRPGGVPV